MRCRSVAPFSQQDWLEWALEVRTLFAEKNPLLLLVSLQPSVGYFGGRFSYRNTRHFTHIDENCMALVSNA